MDESIKVTVVKFGDRPHLQMQYRDPITNRKVTRSTKTNKRRDAERVAAKWEAELREGKYQPPSKITWDDFRDRYEDEVLPSLAEETGRVYFTVFNTIEEILAPKRLAELSASRLSYYQAELRRGTVQENGSVRMRSEATIRTYLAHLGAALKWASKIGLIRAVPEIQRPARANASRGGKLMKGRPITLEEFERMLAATPGIVGNEVASSWTHYLTGLWLSGLRLTESLELYWDRLDRLCVCLDGKHPMLRIPAELEKGNQDRLLPIVPEFAEFLLSTPQSERRGRVFKPMRRRGSNESLRDDWVGRIISRIGKKAGVRVHVNPRTEIVKFATAHDLRRSFGERWALRVMPAVLQELMRHESIDTTMNYYVGRNAVRTADVLWQTHGKREKTDNKRARPRAAAR